MPSCVLIFCINLYIFIYFSIKKKNNISQIQCKIDFTFYRIACDSWLMLEFPVPDSGQTLLMRATKLRNKWDFLLNQRLQGTKHISFDMIKLYYFSLPPLFFSFI